jgi:2OG-Fe(II) oxygenase superfamily
MQDEVSGLLAQISASGSFATRRIVAAGDLRLVVRGVGRIGLPITRGTAHGLCEIARPARYGLRNQTRLDRRVRDTWEIPKSRISIDQPRWRRTLLPQLDRIRRDLGLPEGSRLTAELHNMLVYEPGQFFVSHQDSEKKDDMIATLVVILPSDFTGGGMVLEHHGETITVSGSRGKLTFVAFYADCHHRVRPVTRGYRVVLTYNLMLEGGAAPVAAPPHQIEALARGVRRFFETPRPPRWPGESQREPPDRLVYLLDHQYTQRGLAWSRLKNADAERAVVLREVARRLDCEIVLALADAHETWACEEEEPRYGHYGYRRRGYRRYGEEDEEDVAVASSETPALTELLDSQVELRHWVRSGGRPEAIGGAVGPEELCYTRASVELDPFASEHEGYMGNWGNTVDRWYHRAAVVLWPRARTFVIRAKASARWAIGEVAKALRAGDPGDARRMTAQLLPFWVQVAERESGRGFFERTLGIAARLDSPDVAASLLDPFALTRLTPSAAPRLIELLDRYGLEWCQTLLGRWASEDRAEGPEARAAWLMSALPGLCRPLCAVDSRDGLELSRWLAAEQWAWVVRRYRQVREYTEPKRMIDALTGLSKPILGLIESSLVAQHPELSGDIVGFLSSTASGYPVRALAHLLRTAHESYRRGALPGFGLKPVHAHCVSDLTTRLGTPPRPNDDWSIPEPVRCTCKLCGTLARFLRAPDQVRFDWPLAKEQRAHVHQIVDSHGVPVNHTTRRTGRPFTLVLEKTDAVFRRRAAERAWWQSEFRWLTRTAGAF